MHGSLLLAGAIYVYFAGEKAMGAAYGARHMLFLMGIFAVYTGFIYNDYTSVPLYLF